MICYASVAALLIVIYKETIVNIDFPMDLLYTVHIKEKCPIP